MNKVTFFLFLAVVAASCINPRKYEDLNTNYTKTRGNLRDCRDSTRFLVEENRNLKVKTEDMEKRITHLEADSTETMTMYTKQKKLYDDLNALYEQLMQKKDTENEKHLKNLKALESSLLERERKLRQQESEMNRQDSANKALVASLEQKQSQLDKKQQELESNIQRVKELEMRMAQKDSLTNALKKSIMDALTGFNDNDLTVSVKDGKVYVSLAEQLLFASGSTVVDGKGKQALLQLSKALQSKNDINIMVEGHTDDVPMNGKTIKDNWDLSVLRATSIVRILTEEGSIDPTRVIASGRSQYFPVDAAKTAGARKKNRRTEIILSPKLDELYKLLNQK